MTGTCARRLVLLFAPLATVPSAAPAQSGAELHSLGEEQEALRRRLDTLRQKMTLLIGRLEGEGRAHAADLLRRGIARLDQIDADGLSLDRAMARAAGDLRGGTPASVLEIQAKVIADLEQLLTILLDRQDLERLEKELEAYQEWLQTISKLLEEEGKIREETADLSDRGASEAERAARQSIEALREKQAGLERQARESEAALRSLEEAANELDRLVASQGAVLEAVRSAAEAGEGAEDPEASTLLARARVLEEALARALAMARAAQATEALRERAAESSRKAASGEITPEEFRRAVADLAALARRSAAELAGQSAAELAEKPAAGNEGRATKPAEEGRRAAAEAGSSALEKFAESLEALAAGAEGAEERVDREAAAAAERAAEALDRGRAATEGFRSEAEAASPPTEGGRRAAEEAAAAAQRAAQALEETSDLAAASQAAGEAVRSLERSAQASASARQRTAAEEAELADRAARVAEALGATSSPPAGQDAAKSARAAEGSLREAARNLSAGDARGAQPAASEALERLRRAREEVEKALEEERGRLRPKDEALADEQDRLAAEAERLAAELSRDGSQGGLSPSQAEGSSGATQEAGSRMREAASAGRQGDRSQAGSSRASARESLERALEALGAGRRLQDEALEESKRLARRQEEIRKRILELRQRMQERPNAPKTGGLDRASDSANDAEESLDRGDVGEAEPLEEDVERYLEQAQEEIEREQERYLRLREEELLFKIGEELARMAEAHGEAHARTVEIDRERREADGLTRAMRLALRRIARDEEAIATDTARVAQALEEEGTTVFAFLLRANEEDLRRVVEAFATREAPTDDRIQGLQEDVAKRIEDLRQALKDEIRRRQQRQQPESTNPGSRRPPLVSDLAELKMLKALEEGILARTREFGERLEIFEEVDPRAAEEMLRLGHRHHRITELFEEFMRRLGHDPDAPPTETPEEESR